MPSVNPRKSKRARQAAKAEIRKILDELWDAQLLAEQFRKAHCQAQRLHALNSVTDPERWRGAMERSLAAVATLKTKLAAAVEVLKATYKNPEAFEALGINERFWLAPKVLRAHDAMVGQKSEQFLRKARELQVRGLLP